nr:immunoglobulin light chain junction region [Macaca mulatta]MOX21580.1 immunoglobulin light chain junction region [Macaca mulatta]MOX22471.1 immunoglobulin light chain junction region [Macaca mulatta]
DYYCQVWDTSSHFF